MMNDITAPLRQDEKAVLLLRNLYEQYGYKKYKMSKFENYELYLENKSFLASEKIVTFTDPRGKLLALKPDITLSIVKNAPKEIEGTYKVYYDENVYRAGAAGDDNIKEIMQVGIELIGIVEVRINRFNINKHSSSSGFIKFVLFSQDKDALNPSSFIISNDASLTEPKG